jgi:diacylglycerol kinase (CTP)
MNQGHQEIHDPLQPRPTATRKSLQLPRRLFHMGMGTLAAILYHAFFSHQQAVYLLGTCLCLFYLAEQIRISYPELTEHYKKLAHYFLRAEEHLKESAGIPFAMGLLLTILSFPKAVTLTAILTLSYSDPLSAIIGIQYGRIKVTKNKSLEGSLAFFSCTFMAAFIVALSYSGAAWTQIIIYSLMVALSSSLFELLPIRIDDNLTIPLFTALSAWIFSFALAIY